MGGTGLPPLSLKLPISSLSRFPVSIPGFMIDTSFLIHLSLRQHWWSACCVPGLGLDTEDARICKNSQVPCSHRAQSSQEDKRKLLHL